MTGTLHCPKCEGPFTALEESGPAKCSRCHSAMVWHAFPALSALGGEVVVQKPAPVIMGGASCFYHDGKAAAAACDECGRYLCDSCAADWLGKTMCLGCIHTQREVRKSGAFQSKVTIYDNIALAMLILPAVTLIYWPVVVIFTAPIALFLVIRHRNASLGIVPRGKGRLFVAGILSLLSIVGWIAMFVWMLFI